MLFGLLLPAGYVPCGMGSATYVMDAVSAMHAACAIHAAYTVQAIYTA